MATLTGLSGYLQTFIMPMILIGVACTCLGSTQKSRLMRPQIMVQFTIKHVKEPLPFTPA
jgi:hypothetical protein